MTYQQSVLSVGLASNWESVVIVSLVLQHLADARHVLDRPERDHVSHHDILGYKSKKVERIGKFNCFHSSLETQLD